MQPQLPLVPKRSLLIYRHLCKAQRSTAKELATMVHSTPNAIYRDIQPLTYLGLVERLDERPIRYATTPHGYAEEVYMNTISRAFREQFGINQDSLEDSFANMSFIKDRKEVREVTEREAELSNESIRIITSGHRVAESTIDVYRKASYRGVELRAIIENHPEKNKNVDLEAYKIMRFNVRYHANIGIRMYIFDNKTVVLTSYDPRYPARAFGVRFRYGPVAKQLQDLYDQRWAQSESIYPFAKNCY